MNQTIWCSPPPNGSVVQYRWNPSADGSQLLSYDAYYRQFSGRAIPVLKGVAPHLIGSHNYLTPNAERFEMKALSPAANNSAAFPVPASTTITGYDDVYFASSGQDQPKDYMQMARWATLYALRYGKQVNVLGYNDLNQYVKVSTETGYTQQILKELGYLSYIEMQNEPEKSWRDNGSVEQVRVWNNNIQYFADNDGGKTFYQYKPNQFAALLSAAYDGGGQSADFLLGSGGYLGVRNVAPGTKMVMGGMYDFHGGYVEKMLRWFDINRAGENQIIPFDVLNFHHYSSKKQCAFNWKSVPTMGIVPIIEDNTTPNTITGTALDIFKAKVYNHYGNVEIAWGGVHPEIDQIKEKLSQTLADVFDGDYLVNDEGDVSTSNPLSTAIQNEIKAKELWVSEFGYDTHPDLYEGPGIKPPGNPDNNALTVDYYSEDFVNIPDRYNYGITSNPSEVLDFSDRPQVQAQWLVRSYLELSAVDVSGVKVDKAMAFTMTDVAGRQEGGINYDHSGLLFNDGSPKPAWYHVQTLRQTLQDYVFDADVSGTVLVKDATGVVLSGLRVYRYEHKGNPLTNIVNSFNGSFAHRYVYAVWSPTFNPFVANGCTITLSDVIGSSTTNSNFFKTNANLTATLVASVDLDEDGKRSVLADNMGTIGSFTVSEQPTFIYTAYNTANALPADPTINAVTNVQVENWCCGQIRLTWDWADPAGYEVAKYQIYFLPANQAAEIANMTDLMAKATLYTQEAYGKSCLVAHSDLEIDVSYRFYVVPMVELYVSKFNKYYVESITTLLLPDWAAISTNSFKEGTPQSGQNIAIQSNQLIGSYQAYPNAVTVVNDVFLTNGQNCSKNLHPNNSLAVIADQPGLVNDAVTVSFDVPTRLHSITFEDFRGAGRIKIEVLLCGRDENRLGCWTLVDIINMNGYSEATTTTEPSAKFQYVTTKLSKRAVSKVRITPLDNQAGTRYIRFCGIAADCSFIEPQKLVGNNVSSVKHITETSAQIEWSKVFLDDMYGEAVCDYQVQVSDQRDADGAPKGGLVFNVHTDGGDASVFETIDQLMPGKLYAYWIFPLYQIDPCDISSVYPRKLPQGPMKMMGEFTTLGSSPLFMKAQIETTELNVYPNPARNLVTIDLKGQAFEKIELTNGLGVVVLSESIAKDATVQEISVLGLPAGWFVVRAVRADGTFESKVLLVNY